MVRGRQLQGIEVFSRRGWRQGVLSIVSKWMDVSLHSMNTITTERYTKLMSLWLTNQLPYIKS